MGEFVNKMIECMISLSHTVKRVYRQASSSASWYLHMLTFLQWLMFSYANICYLAPHMLQTQSTAELDEK